MVSICRETCSACGLCAEVCPVPVFKQGEKEILVRPDRLGFCIRCGQCMAVCPTRSIKVEGFDEARDFFALPEGRAAELPFLEMITSRRSIRNFKDQPVPKAVLEQVVRAISFAPPGFLPIKTELVVVQDSAVLRKALPEMVQVYDRLVKAMHHPVARWFVRRKVGRAKFKTLEHHVVPLMQSRLPELKQGVEDTLTRRAPAMILFHAAHEAENYETDIHLALAYGFLAAHALGLGACVIDLIPPTLQNSPALQKLFGIPQDHAIVSAMILGYPKYRYQRGIRRELKSVTWI